MPARTSAPENGEVERVEDGRLGVGSERVGEATADRAPPIRSRRRATSGSLLMRAAVHAGASAGSRATSAPTSPIAAPTRRAAERRARRGAGSSASSRRQNTSATRWSFEEK